MQAGFLSRETVLDQDGFDHKEELEKMEREHVELNKVQQSDTIAKQEINNTIQVMQTRNNIIAQYEGETLQKQIMEEIQGDDKEKNKVKIEQMAEEYALTLMSQDPKMAIATLQRMNKEMPNLHALVMEKIKNFQPQLPQQAMEQSPSEQSPVVVPEQPPITPETSAPNIGQENVVKLEKPLSENKPPRRQTGGV
jgi:hypothetical protein